MATSTTKTNKPLNPRGQDQSPKGYNRAELYTGKALDFDGVNDEVTTAYTSGFTGTQEFTYCAYVYTNSTTLRQTIIHANENTGYGLQSLQTRDGAFRFFAGTGSGSTSYLDSELYEANKWYFVVGTHTATENKIYLNGVLNATNTADELTIPPDEILIGNYPQNVNQMDGYISNAKVFDVALTAAQVADLYNNPEKIVPTGVSNDALKLWLPMQEGAGTTAYDGSGNGNHGTISGATYTHGIGAPVSQTAVIDWNKAKNTLIQSEDYSTSNWNRISTTINATNITAPNGKDVATDLRETTANSRHAIGTFTGGWSTGENQVVGGFFKYNGRQYIQFAGLGLQSVNEAPIFDIQNGVLHKASTSNVCTDAFIEDYGNGWYKCTALVDPTGSALFDFSLMTQIIHDNYDNYTGDVSKGVFVWGLFQVENESTKQPYLTTLGTKQLNDVLLPAGLTTGRDITGVNLFENVRKQGALNLDGNSWAEVHDNASLDITDAITLEAWVYWDGTDNKGILGRWHNDSFNRNYLFYKLNESTLNFYINGSAITSFGSLSSSKGWTHIVGTYDRTSAILYIDGVGQTPIAHTTAISTGTLPLEIGRNFTSLTRALEAPLAQPRIYNRALSAEEVQRSYDSGKNIFTND